jgi:hypothetical protein
MIYFAFQVFEGPSSIPHMLPVSHYNLVSQASFQLLVFPRNSRMWCPSRVRLGLPTRKQWGFAYLGVLDAKVEEGHLFLLFE